MIARLGDGPGRASIPSSRWSGFVLIIWGFGMARQSPVVLWDSPEWPRHIAIALNLVAFVLFAVYLVPAGRMKARLGHPMVLSVKVWAFAHLLANGTLADIFLFGAFLVWAIVDYASSRRRDRAAGTVRVAGPARNDVIAVVVGVVIWAAILWRVH